MAAIRIPSTDADTPTGNTREDSPPLPLEAVHEGWRLCADTPEEILGLLIDGYADQPDEQSRLQARIRLAVEAQGVIQALLNAGELFDYCTEEEMQILLHDPAVPPTPEVWQCAIPLVLVTSFYQPLGEHLQPRTAAPGKIWWHDPSTAWSLLETLHGTRWLDFKITGMPGKQAADSKAYPKPDTEGAYAYHWRNIHTRS